MDSNPDFHGGPTQSRDASSAFDTPVKRGFTENAPTIHSQLQGKAALEEHDIGRTVINQMEDPTTAGEFTGGEASVGEPEKWFPVRDMRMSSEVVEETVSRPQEGRIPEGGNQLREENPGAYFDENARTLEVREGVRSRGRGKGSFGPGTQVPPGPDENSVSVDPDVEPRRAEGGGGMFSATH
jgi:hypothetical protein